ncbi:MAG: addiction module protein [Burkholderiales bacterium]
MQLDDIAHMPTQARLQAMELLWKSLRESSQADDIVPLWHQQVLQDRLNRLALGAEQTMPWEQAKDRLRALTKPPEVK